MSCGHRFTTYEQVVKTRLRVVKRDGRLEELDRGKLVKGMFTACQKRPISVHQIEALADAIVTELENEFEREVPSTVIGKRVMDRMETLDEIAYVRFASVYRRFRDVSQFLSEVEGLIGRE
jgi:transcriptional repressor NrdR